ncbi:MAG TPA: APC family permease [Anaerolineales bacterium]|nr:APC family permease [Anaerolineales bacterium]HMR99496.1 APC family permease [Anaerolineales bacterium]HNQ94064.1 APC family permease [Anaerolineales bacterium]HNS59820.1 APC family permease [Anaerolineales bacterium]
MSHQKNIPSTQFIHRTAKHPTSSLSHFLLGRPLSTADAAHETIGKSVGLAVFAADALSSTAYATQEILVILAGAGALAFGYVFPISIVIVALLAIVVISYEQVIHAYPGGGGAYIVAADNLGKFPALIAAAALLTDYILTVSVSISSGVAQIVSAYPQWYEYRVVVAVFFVILIMVINLRGVRESGAAFAIPSYFFIAMMLFMIGTGFFRILTSSLGTVVNPPEIEHVDELTGISLFLLLHAFSSGTTAMTGVEAISNGITAFKEPRSRNAGITLIWMACILGVLFIGISFLTREIHAVPSETETVISQLARTIFNGQELLYLGVILGTTVILILAANTAFAGFPRLSALLANDGFVPRQLTYRGSRLVYSYGIIALAAAASILIIVFQASVTRLIPLYAIGVFLSFTLAQAGMTRRWWRSGKLNKAVQPEDHNRPHPLHYDKRWFIKMISNALGALCTALVVGVFAVTKFHDGAWIVLILTPILIGIFLWIHRHYKSMASRLSLEKYGEPPPYNTRHRVIVAISNVHKGTLAALRYARMLSDDVTAVHVSLEPEDTEKVQTKWAKWGRGTRLVIVDSPYRLFLEPLLNYIDDILATRQPNETITIVVPHFVPTKRIHNALHMQTAELLRRELLETPGVVITEVPYQVS